MPGCSLAFDQTVLQIMACRPERSKKKARKDVVRSTMPPVRRAGFRVLVLVVRHLCAGKIAVGN
jgi:hypothetical protein